ncbi:MAG TPA: VCBS repeat-containing protein, partial [Blastocatellia bacterium]|nr:VCBS repeat-containing protein [Blastocatellia bacterium]
MKNIFCRLTLILSLFALLLIAACNKKPEETANNTPPPATDAAQQNAPAASPSPSDTLPPIDPSKFTPVEFTDVTAQAGIRFKHNNGAFGKKYLPETNGSGCAFIDYDNDGWQDVLLINSSDFADAPKKRNTVMALYHNNQNGTFTDVTAQSGLAKVMYGQGVAVGDYDNDGLDDVFVTAVGQNRLFKNAGGGKFTDVTAKVGLQGPQYFSSSAAFFDYDKDGKLDLFVCNYIEWSPDKDVFCSLDGTNKSYCTPEKYPGQSSRLYRNTGGKFADVTEKAGLLDPTGKALGVTILDYDKDGWSDIFVANDTQPNKLYHNSGKGSFVNVAESAGVAYSIEGKARGGMGTDAAD